MPGIPGQYIKHAQFVARTVLVKNGNVDAACKTLNRIMAKEGMIDQFRLTQRYEKPCQFRRRINFERSKAIYNEDMERKVLFVLRKNRVDPYPASH